MFYYFYYSIALHLHKPVFKILLLQCFKLQEANRIVDCLMLTNMYSEKAAPFGTPVEKLTQDVGNKVARACVCVCLCSPACLKVKASYDMCVYVWLTNDTYNAGYVFICACEPFTCRVTAVFYLQEKTRFSLRNIQNSPNCTLKE